MIRPFSLTDLDRILQIEQPRFSKVSLRRNDFCPTALASSRDLLGLHGQRKREGGRPTFGLSSLSRDGHMISIAVHPHHRRKGIGKELIEEAVQRFRLKKLWAEVRKSNRRAQSFYLKLGFKIVDEVPNYYGNEDALIFRWIPPALHCPETGASIAEASPIL